MKTTILQSSKCLIVGIALTAINVNIAYTQGNRWGLDGNNNVDSSNFIGPINAEDLRVKTNDTTRVTVKENGDVKIEKDLNVKGKITIGLNTFQLNSIDVGGPGGPIDKITSSFGILAFGNTNPPFSNILLGLGTQTPAFTLSLAGDGINTNGGILSVGTFDFTGLLQNTLKAAHPRPLPKGGESQRSKSPSL